MVSFLLDLFLCDEEGSFLVSLHLCHDHLALPFWSVVSVVVGLYLVISSAQCEW